VCEAFTDIKAYVEEADVMITKIASLPSYDRPTQGEGVFVDSIAILFLFIC
jgi:hypothetical protein